MIKIAISGAGGRMGRRVAAMAVASREFQIVAAVEAAGHETIGKDVGELAGQTRIGVKVAAELTGRPDVLIDFSAPAGALACLAASRRERLALVLGTTGLTDIQQAEVADAARDIPILQSANMSVGVNVLLKLAAQAAVALGPDYDVEITETLHRFKKDAPSGTAIALARSICAALGKDYGASAVFGRGGMGSRKPGEIGLHALRMGDTVGEHTVQFGNLGETITFGHSAHTRDTFAAGALRAAAWIAGKPAGLYTMADVLGL